MYLKALEYHNKRKIINQYKTFDDASSNPTYCPAHRQLMANMRDRMQNDGGEVGRIINYWLKSRINDKGENI
mgnify:CR=1 FL=1